MNVEKIQTRAESYRELAMQAISCIAKYRSRIEQFRREGDTEIAAEYQTLLNDAIVRAERYLLLADFAEKDSMSEAA